MGFPALVPSLNPLEKGPEILKIKVVQSLRIEQLPYEKMLHHLEPFNLEERRNMIEVCKITYSAEKVDGVFLPLV